MQPPSLFLIFNHTFTSIQIADAHNNLGVDSIIEMPDHLKNLWSNIPPESSGVYDFLQPIRRWIKKRARKNDYILIQGDFGACYLMVNFSFETGLIPVYSTTSRVVEEQLHPDGSIQLKHRFKHQIFRKYGL